MVLYSYAKYYTWGCNFLLGWGLAIAPAGAWIGVTGHVDLQPVLLSFAVATWAGGFDILYSCTDYDFDGKYGVNSVSRRFGIAGAFNITRGMHFLSACAFLALGLWLELNYFYYIGWAIAVSLLVLENAFPEARRPLQAARPILQIQQRCIYDAPHFYNSSPGGLVCCRT